MTVPCQFWSILPWTLAAKSIYYFFISCKIHKVQRWEASSPWEIQEATAVLSGVSSCAAFFIVEVNLQHNRKQNCYNFRLAMQKYVCSVSRTETNFHTTTLQWLIKKIVVSDCQYVLLSQNIKSAFSWGWSSEISLPVDALGFKSIKIFVLEDLNFYTFWVKATLSLRITQL